MVLVELYKMNIFGLTAWLIAIIVLITLSLKWIDSLTLHLRILLQIQYFDYIYDFLKKFSIYLGHMRRNLFGFVSVKMRIPLHLSNRRIFSQNFCFHGKIFYCSKTAGQNISWSIGSVSTRSHDYGNMLTLFGQIHFLLRTDITRCDNLSVGCRCSSQQTCLRCLVQKVLTIPGGCQVSWGWD